MKMVKLSIIAMCSMLFIVMMIIVFNQSVFANENSYGNSFKLLVTSDIHSYFEKTYDLDMNNTIVEHGDASKAATIIKQRRSKDSIYIDGGDFSMGTLMQTGFENHAYELKLLGKLGCDVTTFGNHEFDFGADALARMLNNAKASNEKIPEIVQSNIMLDESSNLAKAFNNYDIKQYIVKEVNGVKIGIFGLEGIDSVKCIQEKNLQWHDYIDAAKKTVKELQDKCDVIVCLSHSGTNLDGNDGEDINLLKEVPQINICLSGHTHCNIEPKKIGDSYLFAPGCYLKNIDELNFSKNDNDEWELTNYENIKLSDDVAQDESVLKTLEQYNAQIKNEYLDKYSNIGNVDDVICQSPYTYENVDIMSKSIEEYPMQDLIADSYRYAANKLGENNVDVAINGIGTVRSTIIEGPIKVSDAFKICSLGVGEDGSAGHDLYAAYILGKDLGNLIEIETSLGKYKSGMKLAYSGLKIKWNNNRIPLDKVTDIKVEKEDGSLEDFDPDKLYKVVLNGYSVNMIDALNNLSNGIIKFIPKNKYGNDETDKSMLVIRDEKGNELKEWVAFKDYLQNLKVIPSQYDAAQERKVNTNETGLVIFKNPGPATWFTIIFTVVVVFLLIFIVYKIVKKCKNYKKSNVKK